MENPTEYGYLHQLFDNNFMDYTSYVIKERAIPDVTDGLKPVQRRIMQTLFNMDDGRFHKVANVVGETMKLHPHGDQSIFDALVNLANKGYLVDRQGNFGNIFTGDQASAPRYIECRLSPLALETLFNKDLTEFIDSYDGRMQEPVRLPAKIPLLLLLGAEGIAVGMATKIMSHNFGELLQAQIDYLRGKEFILYPDFLRGGIIDVADYNHGNGRLLCRVKLARRARHMADDEHVPAVGEACDRAREAPREALFERAERQLGQRLVAEVGRPRDGGGPFRRVCVLACAQWHEVTRQGKRSRDQQGADKEGADVHRDGLEVIRTMGTTASVSAARPIASCDHAGQSASPASGKNSAVLRATLAASTSSAAAAAFIAVRVPSARARYDSSAAV